MKMTNEDIKSRIKYLIHELRLTQGEFAEKIGCDQSNLSKHLNGKLPISEALINKIVINLGVSKSWLKDGLDVPFPKYSSGMVPELLIDESEMKSMKGTPVYDIDVTAGSLSRPMMFADEHIVGAVNMPNISQDCRIVRVSGDSMCDAGIMHGDYVLVDSSRTVNSGDIVVASVDDEFTIKKIVFGKPNRLVPCNKEYSQIEINENTRVVIIGPVISVVRKYH